MVTGTGTMCTPPFENHMLTEIRSVKGMRSTLKHYQIVSYTDRHNHLPDIH